MLLRRRRRGLPVEEAWTQQAAGSFRMRRGAMYIIRRRAEAYKLARVCESGATSCGMSWLSAQGRDDG